MKSECCNIDLFELDLLLHKAGIVISRNMEIKARIFQWRTRDVQDEKEIQLFRFVYESLRRYYFKVKQGFESCVEDAYICRLIETLKNWVVGCKEECRSDVFVSDNPDWDNQRCRSRSRFLKDIGIACEYVFDFSFQEFEKQNKVEDFINLLQTQRIPNEILFDFVMKTKSVTNQDVNHASCITEYELLIQKTCEIDFNYTDFIAKCKLDASYSDKKVCILNLDTYTYLKKCGLGYEEIYKVVTCNPGLKFEYRDTCLFMIHENKTYDLCKIKYKQDFTNYLTDCNLS